MMEWPAPTEEQPFHTLGYVEIECMYCNSVKNVIIIVNRVDAAQPENNPVDSLLTLIHSHQLIT